MREKCRFIVYVLDNVVWKPSNSSLRQDSKDANDDKKKKRARLEAVSGSAWTEELPPVASAVIERRLIRCYHELFGDLGILVAGRIRVFVFSVQPSSPVASSSARHDGVGDDGVSSSSSSPGASGQQRCLVIVRTRREAEDDVVTAFEEMMTATRGGGGGGELDSLLKFRGCRKVHVAGSETLVRRAMAKKFGTNVEF